MNIKEAKIHIKNAIAAYFQKDETGEYVIPVEKQRPVFLYGPPGIGKTAVMEQIAEEMEIGLVSYSMTHHTRQSAIGLPFITKKVFDGKEYDVSEYTMSEILASVYEYIEKSGKKEGILFLDEINCVSETLSPSMLRFLQYKTFGSHAVPDGWVVVTAGNPPEFNKSVREYDIATLDRIKKIDVEANYDVWREYAVNKNVHPAIIAYLDVKKSDFYIIENTPKGKNFVTARGWEDLSRMMSVFENKNIDIDISLIEQYIQSQTVAEDFSDYYETYKNLTAKFSTEDIVTGNWSEELSSELRNSAVSEKLGFINILSGEMSNVSKVAVNFNKTAKNVAELLKENQVISKTPKDAVNLLDNLINTFKADRGDKNIYFRETNEQKKEKLMVFEKLSEIRDILTGSEGETKIHISDFLKTEIEQLKNLVETAQTELSNTCEFLYKTFGESPELQIFISNITVNKYSSLFLMSFGCKKFSEISKSKFDENKVVDELSFIL